MDVNDLRSAVTVISLLLFLALVGWTWSARRKRAFQEAEQLPFLDDEDDNTSRAPGRKAAGETQ